MLRKDERLVMDNKCIDQLRSLSLDMINEANSGHPGIALGAAPLIYSIFARNLVFDPSNPKWINRDRFVLSAGHGSALLYSTLFMSGYNITIDDLKNFRKIDSITPGHPEYGVTPGVEMSTGPLGQGFASSVGMAIAERYLASIYNKNKRNIIDYYTYVLCGDGDLMEGVSYEAASLAGTLKLNKLIVLYDSNNICLDGKTNTTFNDNIAKRFESLGWNYLLVNNEDDIEAIDKAIKKAKSSDKPTLIEVKTTIGKYSSLQGTNKVHGSVLSEEDTTNIKKKMDIRDIPFTVSNETVNHLSQQINERNSSVINDWNKKFNKLDDNTKKMLEELTHDIFDIDMKELDLDFEGITEEAPRETAGKVLNALAKCYPYIIGGSADVASSTKAYLEDMGDFASNKTGGRNILYGVREHAMGAITNGLALSGMLPFASTFLTFSDYMKPSIRLAALMNLPVMYLFTHDSITIGEDGPTHQPIEQLISLRSIPNVEVFRPADPNEVIGSFKAILDTLPAPKVLALSRNKTRVLSETSINEVSKGGYIVKDFEKNKSGIIIATGEQLQDALDVRERLVAKGLDVRVISMPSIERFLKQPSEYQEKLLPLGVKKVVIEASSSYSWNSFVYNDKYLFTTDDFGHSGSKEDILKKNRLDIDTLEEEIEKLFK